MTLESDAKKIWDFLDDLEEVGEIIYQVKDSGCRLTVTNGAQDKFTMEFES